MAGRIPSAGYEARICTADDCTFVKPQLQQYFCLTRPKISCLVNQRIYIHELVLNLR